MNKDVHIKLGHAWTSTDNFFSELEFESLLEKSLISFDML